jgi:hypothetical protein
MNSRARTAAAPDSTTRLPQLLLAASAWQEAIALEPNNWVCRFQAAKVLLAAQAAALFADPASVQELGRQARNQLAEAQRLNPLSPEIYALEAH